MIEGIRRIGRVARIGWIGRRETEPWDTILLLQGLPKSSTGSREIIGGTPSWLIFEAPGCPKYLRY